jgi:hypothetical protein
MFTTLLVLFYLLEVIPIVVAQHDELMNQSKTQSVWRNNKN